MSKKYGHYANDCNSDKCYNFGRVGHFAKDFLGEKKVEETISLALNDATNEGILLMAQNEELKSREHGGAKDDGDSREAVEAVENEVTRSGFGEIAISETRKSKKDEQLDNRELELEERGRKKKEDENGRRKDGMEKKDGRNAD